MVKKLSDMVGLVSRARALVRKGGKRNGTSGVEDIMAYILGGFEFILHGDDRDGYPAGDFYLVKFQNRLEIKLKKVYSFAKARYAKILDCRIR